MRNAAKALIKTVLFSLCVVVASTYETQALSVSRPMIQSGMNSDVNIHRAEVDVNIGIGIGRFYDRNRHGRRCSFRNDYCRNYYRGSYYENRWWNDFGPRRQQNFAGIYSQRHVNWCMDRYRSYNVRTNTWLSFSGTYRQCRSPF
jgi:BA14K-like protein